MNNIPKKVIDTIWPILSYIKLRLSLLKPSSRQSIRSICDQINQTEFQSDSHKVNFVRNWVNSHSVHLIDDEHDSYAFNVSIVLQKVLACSSNEGKKPHLSCGPRSYLMKSILDNLGIKNRIIDLFGLTGAGVLKVSPHTLIEVFCASDQSWSLQDPDFNVVYSHKETGKPLSVKQMLLLPNEKLSYDSNGYQVEMLVNLDNTIAGLFEFGALYRYSYVGKKSVLLLKAEKEILNSKVMSHENFSIAFPDFIRQRAYAYRIVDLSSKEKVF